MDLNSLQAQAGETTYQRGSALARAGDVTIIRTSKQGDRQAVAAQVLGTHRYTVELTFENGKLVAAACSCPAFDYQTVCKHCVATAIAADSPEPTRGEANGKLSRHEQEEARLKTHLLAMDKGELTDLLLSYIASDRTDWKNWLLKAELSAQPADKKALKKLITKAFPKRHLWDYAKVDRYFRQAEAVFTVFTDQLPSLEAEDALDLLLRAIERLNTVLMEGIDDSGGFRLELEANLCGALVAQFRRLDWSDRQRAEWLVEQLCQSRDVFPSIPTAFDLTPAEHQSLLDCCQVRLDSLPDVRKSNNATRRQIDALSRVLAQGANNRA